ncbi:MAG: hydantoinase/oxoprolinase family protein, partial [Candidatus Puniceispirillales bacterium]
GRTVDSMAVEITVWSVNAFTAADDVEPVPETETTAATTAGNDRPLFDPATGQMLEATAIIRQTLEPGMQAAGPLLITEDETTVVVSPRFDITARGDGCLVLNRRNSEDGGVHD